MIFENSKNSNYYFFTFIRKLLHNFFEGTNQTIDDSQILRMHTVLVGILSKRRNKGQTRNSNDHRTEFLAILRAFWAYLPDYDIYDLCINYRCTDASNTDIVKLLSHVIHRWTFFAGKEQTSFPIVPQRNPQSTNHPPLPPVYLSSFFPTEKGTELSLFMNSINSFLFSRDI